MRHLPPAHISAVAMILMGMTLLPLILDNYLQYVLNLMLCYVVVGIGLNLLLGYAGQFAFASAALMGIGAYTSALLTTRAGLSWWIALPLAGVAAAAIGTLGVFPAMRMKRVYLALLTVAFAQLVWWTMIHWKDVTLGSYGVGNVPPSLFGVKLRGDKATYYVVGATVVVMYALARWIIESRIGRAFVAIRENETVAMCAGIDVARTKATVFALSAFYSGIGGALFALTVGFVEPNSFTLSQMVVHFSIVMIGGVMSLYGSVIGALLITAFPELLRDLQALQEVIYGALLVLFVIFMPSGVAGWLIGKGWLPREVLSHGWRRFRTGAPAGHLIAVATQERPS